MGKLEELESRVFSLSVEDRNELLKWFAEAYYYNKELLEHGVYDELYIKLFTVYKPLTEDKNALELLRQIKMGEKKPTMNNMSLIVVEQIMIGLTGGIGLDVEHGIDRSLFKYHFNYNHDFVNDLYMSQLEDNIGNKVYVVGRHGKEPMLKTGILNGVTEGQSIKLDDEDINFIGYQHYIKSVTAENKNVLYYNGTKYDMTKLIDSSDIKMEQLRLFNKQSRRGRH